MEADSDQAEVAPIMMKSARTAVAGTLMGIIAIHAMRTSSVSDKRMSIILKDKDDIQEIGSLQRGILMVKCKF